MNKFRLYILLFTILSLFIVSCDKEKKDKIKILVTCDGDFNGDYIYNSADPVGFGGGTTGDNPYIHSGSVYYFSRVFNDLDTIDVETRRTNLTDTLKIRIYRDNTKVKENFIDNSSLEFTLELFYDYDESPSTTSSE